MLASRSLSATINRFSRLIAWNGGRIYKPQGIATPILKISCTTVRPRAMHLGPSRTILDCAAKSDATALSDGARRSRRSQRLRESGVGKWNNIFAGSLCEGPDLQIGTTGSDGSRCEQPRSKTPAAVLNPEQPIAGVAESGHDEAPLVERAVDGRGEDGQAGVMRVHVADSFGCGHQVDQSNPLGAAFAQEVERRHRAAPGGEHRVDEQDFKRAEIFGQAFVIDR